MAIKSQIAIERDKYFNSEEGKILCESSAQGKYLKNRLITAFLAGIKIGKCLKDKGEAEKCPNCITGTLSTMKYCKCGYEER